MSQTTKISPTQAAKNAGMALSTLKRVAAGDADCKPETLAKLADASQLQAALAAKARAESDLAQAQANILRSASEAARSILANTK